MGVGVGVVKNTIKSKKMAFISPPGDPPNPGIEPLSPDSPALAGRFFTTNATGEAQIIFKHN